MQSIHYNKEARQKLINGVNIIADAVKVTLGAKGRNVIIGSNIALPHITKDGVTVAISIEANDPIENMGVQLLKEVANKTLDLAGDGTTTSIVLSQAIINNGIKHITPELNLIDVKKGMDKAKDFIVEELKKISKPIDNDVLLKQIATISANNDSEIGELITNIAKKIGKEGIITIEEGKSTETIVEIVEGMHFDRGYISSHFITNREKSEVELNNVLILICDKKISSIKEVFPLLEQIIKTDHSLLIIAEDLEGEALSAIILNRLKNVLKVCAIKSPAFGERRKHIIEDTAILTGGRVISEEQGLRLESTKITSLGKADKVIITKDSTIIINGKGDKEKISERANQIKSQIESGDSERDKERLKERLAKLTAGVAVIYVGATTETEMKEKKDRIEDAVCAVSSANEEGFVVGGGMGYLICSEKLNELKGLNDDEQVGINIIKKAIEEPFIQILKNGEIDGNKFIDELADKDYGFGFNIKTNSIENLLESGIIDPTKVLRVAIENSISIASTLLTTECVIFKNEKQTQYE